MAIGVAWSAPVESPIVCPPPPDGVEPPVEAEPPSPADPSPLVPALLSPVVAAFPPLSGESTVTGALTVAGASAAAAGEAPAEPTWAAPDEPSTVWPDEPADPLPPAAEADVSPSRVASPPLSGDSTVTGALAVTGASAAALADPLAESTWADPLESDVFCPDAEPEPLSAAVAPESPVREASPPLSGEATVTGAFTVVGALAPALGEPATAPTWAEADEPLVSCPPELDGEPSLDADADVAPL
jgi:hypothetical protein